MASLPDDELITAYLDDELSVDERARAERLLAERPDLRRLLDELRGLREGLQSLPSYRLGDDFGAAVMRRAEREVLRGPDADASPSAAPPIDAKPNAADSGAARGDEVRPNSLDAPRWRRPLAWAIAVVAAALVVMFFEPGRFARRDDERQVAMQPRKDAPPSAATAPVGAAAEAERLKRTDERLAKNGGAAADWETARKAGAVAKEAGAPADGRMNGAVVSNAVVAQPRPGDLVAKLPAALRAPTALGGGALPSASTQAGEANAAPVGPDLTTIVVEKDRRRLEELADNYQALRRKEGEQRGPATALQRQLTLGVAAAPAENDQLLIVQCDVPSRDALNTAFASVLTENRIADVTQYAAATGAVARLVETVDADRPAAVGGKRKADERTAGDQSGIDSADGEEFYYVVADPKQLESTLAALSADRKSFLNVTVEPAPRHQQQLAWQAYNRRGMTSSAARGGAGLPETASYGASSAPAAGPAAVAGAVAAKPPATPSSTPSSTPDGFARPSGVVAGPGPSVRSGSLPALMPSSSESVVGQISQGPVSYVLPVPASRAQRLIDRAENLDEALRFNELQAAKSEDKSRAEKPTSPTPAAQVAATKAPSVPPADSMQIVKRQDAVPPVGSQAWSLTQAGQRDGEYHEALFIFRVVRSGGETVPPNVAQPTTAKPAAAAPSPTNRPASGVKAK